MDLHEFASFDFGPMCFRWRCGGIALHLTSSFTAVHYLTNGLGHNCWIISIVSNIRCSKPHPNWIFNPIRSVQSTYNLRCNIHLWRVIFSFSFLLCCQALHIYDMSFFSTIWCLLTIKFWYIKPNFRKGYRPPTAFIERTDPFMWQFLAS